uniref:Cytochrome b6-f complex subunit 6 n=1 Tax=Osmundea sinicola TaxID=290685 RepID=A0A7L4WPE0_9FLOR|nr:cytochrome b6-f complex subunit 6 [Osmundea sinicola]QFR99866.1 cytochrome b6-f complex subunit 6 [Osmundea sinicola]
MSIGISYILFIGLFMGLAISLYLSLQFVKLI